jgi:hypothetical protein
MLIFCRNELTMSKLLEIHVWHYYWLPTLKFGNAMCLSSAKLLGIFFTPQLEEFKFIYLFILLKWINFKNCQDVGLLKALSQLGDAS